MIHHDHPRFIFLHIPKNAGSSITKTLANYIGVDREVLRPQKYKFLSIGDVRGNGGPRVKLLHPEGIYFVFSVLRNPWDRVVSYFHYLQQIKQPPGNLSKDVTFDRWVRNGGFKGLRPQHTHVGYGDRLDYLARFETLQDDWVKICEGLGIDTPLIHDKKSKHKPFREYYGSVTQHLVGRFYKEDIKRFGYEFD